MIEALVQCLGQSASGPDHLTWTHLKCLMACKKIALLFFWIANACLRTGVWPKELKESKTVVISKLEKLLYDVLKTFRPIVLLNTMDNVIKWFYSIKWFYHFLSILSLRNNGLSSSLIQLSYENTFYLIWGILSILSVFDLVIITLRFKGGHMVNTCQTHVGHMLSICTTVHCCAMLYAQSFILYYSFLFTSLTQPFI